MARTPYKGSCKIQNCNRHKSKIGDIVDFCRTCGDKYKDIFFDFSCIKHKRDFMKVVLVEGIPKKYCVKCNQEKLKYR